MRNGVDALILKLAGRYNITTASIKCNFSSPPAQPVKIKPSKINGCSRAVGRPAPSVLLSLPAILVSPKRFSFTHDVNNSAAAFKLNAILQRLDSKA